MKQLTTVMGRGARRVAKLEALEARQMFNAASPPTVMFEQYVKGTTTSRTFAVLYDGVDPIDRTTLDNNDIRVFSDNDFSAPAVLVATAKTRRGNGLIARYRVDGILSGAYSIEMGEGEVTDTTGAQVDPGIIGRFKIGKKGRAIVGDPQQPFNAMIQIVGTTFGPSFAPPPIDTSFGTVIGAVNFGGAAVDIVGSTGTVVHFESRGGGPAAPIRVTTPFSVSITSSSGSPGDLADAMVGNQPVYETETYTQSWSDEVLTVSGLDPARVYRFQFLHGDTRVVSNPYNEKTQFFELFSGPTATTSLAFNTTTANADSNTAVIVAGTTGLTYRMPASSMRGPSFSGMVVEIGGVAPSLVMPPATFVRKSVRLLGPAHTFDLAFSGDGGPVTAAGLAEKNVLVNGPAGYSARASLVHFVTDPDGSGSATYRIDGIEATGTYAISVDGVNVANPTLFFLLPVKWDLVAVGKHKRHHRVVA